MNWKDSVLKGAARGLTTWLCYGAIEFILAYLLPRFWKPGLEIAPWQWPSLAVVFGVYAVAGALSGATGGALLFRAGKSGEAENFEILAGLSLSAAFLANLGSAWPLARSEQIALGLAGILVALFLAALFSEAWRARGAYLANPLVLALLLLASPWISRDLLRDSGSLTKIGASLLSLAVIALIPLILRKFVPGNAIVRKVATAAVAAPLLWAGLQALGLSPAIQAGPVPATPGKGPNVVLITMDTVRADHLSLYGYGRETTPQLARFSKDATVYDHAIAAGDFTLPSHASIFTGLYPGWHGAYPSHPGFAAGRPLQPGATTLATVLKSHGYWTGGVFANAAFLQASTGLSQGFGIWETGTPVLLADAERPFYLREGARKLLHFGMDTAAYDALYFRASDINSRAFTVLEKLQGRGPFFLFLNYMDAHYPYVPPPPYLDRFPGRQADARPVTAYNALKDSVNAGKRHIARDEQNSLIASYDGGIAYLDSEIGNLMDRLRSMGLYDDTLIIVTSDHGEAFGDHDRIGHTVTSLFQDGSHVPLVVKLPGQHEARRSAALVSHVDLMSTVLETLGRPLPPGLQGRPLSSPRSESDVVYGEAHAIGDHDRNARLRGVRRAAFTTSAKLILWSGGPPEFYNLAADPGESQNRYDAKDPAVASLEASLTAWTAAIPKQLSKPTKLDKESVDRIRSLGYIQK
jgi:arylsulfatase A-like enzyme